MPDPRGPIGQETLQLIFAELQDGVNKLDPGFLATTGAGAVSELMKVGQERSAGAGDKETPAIAGDPQAGTRTPAEDAAGTGDPADETLLESCINDAFKKVMADADQHVDGLASEFNAVKSELDKFDRSHIVVAFEELLHEAGQATYDDAPG